MAEQADDLEQDLILDEEETDLENEHGKSGADDGKQLTDEEFEAQEKERLAGLSPEELVAEALKKSKTNRRLYGRIQKSKKQKTASQPEVKPESKKLEAPAPVDTSKFVTPDQLDEKILQSTKGYTAETMDTLKSIAKGKGVSLIQAEQDTLFKLYLADQKEAERKKKAKLGPATGSGTGSNSKGFRPKMTPEEHQKAWQERQEQGE